VEAQTALKKRQQLTTWEEGLALPLAEEELPTATLTLTLRTCDRFSRHSVAGELCLGLDGVSVPLGAAQWGELKTSVKVWLPLSWKSWTVLVGCRRTDPWPELAAQVQRPSQLGWEAGRGPGQGSSWSRAMAQDSGFRCLFLPVPLTCHASISLPSCLHHGECALAPLLCGVVPIKSSPCAPAMNRHCRNEHSGKEDRVPLFAECSDKWKNWSQQMQ
jgi:hypothetical protein